MNVLLLSGGLESTALCYLCRPELCITIDYGQPSFDGEQRAAGFFCRSLSIEHQVIISRSYNLLARGNSSWWPFRNQLLVTLAATATSHLDVEKILIGIVRTDIYSDCTPAFIAHIQNLFCGQDSGLEISAPGAEMTTLELLNAAQFPEDALDVTFSCHRMSYPCGTCPGCAKSQEVKANYRQIALKRAKATSAASRYL